MNSFFTNNLLRVVSIAGGLLLYVSCSSASASLENKASHNTYHKPLAPHSIAGMDIVLRIENTVTNFSGGVPNKGIAVISYKRDGTFAGEGFGDKHHQKYYGTYKYRRTGFNTAVETAIDVAVDNAPHITTFTFETPTSGKWVEDFASGLIIFSGSFTMVPTNLPEDKHLAPSTNPGYTALILDTATSNVLPDGVYPSKGLALQRYAEDGTFTIQGFGPGLLNSTGTYSFKKVSANTVVEEAIQVSDLFTLPYTMVYTFETPTSGVWYQNLGDGFLKFTGTFNVFAK